MEKKKNSSTLNLDLYFIKNINDFIPKLQESIEFQKLFISEIEKHINNIIIGREYYSDYAIYVFDILPFVIKELGIPFTYYFFKNENLVDNLIELSKKRMFEEDYTINKLFYYFIKVFNFTLNKNPLEKWKKTLIQSGIIDNDESVFTEHTNKLTIEQNLYEELAFLFFKWKELRLSSLEEDYIIQLENNLSDIIDDFKSLSRVAYFDKSKIDFFQELIQEIIDFKSLGIKNNISQNQMKSFIDKKENEIKIIPLKEKTFFYKNEKINERKNEITDFNNYVLPLTKESIFELKRQICSFLNSKGGRLYLGISEQNIVKGILMNYKTRDLLRNTLVNLSYDFYPKCRLDKIMVYFIPIKEPESKKFLKDLFVVKIRIYQGENYLLYSWTDKDYNSSIRINSRCVDLNSNEIYKEIIKREKFKDEKLIIENEPKDPVPEINPLEFEINENMNIINGWGKKKYIYELNEDNNACDFEPKIFKKFEREDIVSVKVSNIDINLSIEEIKRFFQGCGCFSQKFFINKNRRFSGYGYLNFYNFKDAEKCFSNYNGILLGTRNIKLKMVY